MIQANQVVSVPVWQLLAFLAAITLCTLMRKSIGMVLAGFLFSIHWVFLQSVKGAKTEGQEYTLLAFFFAFGLVCALSIAWRYYKSDHYE